MHAELQIQQKKSNCSDISSNSSSQKFCSRRRQQCRRCYRALRRCKEENVHRWKSAFSGSYPIIQTPLHIAERLMLIALSARPQCFFIKEQMSEKISSSPEDTHNASSSSSSSLSGASAVSLVPPNSSGRIRQRCCHTRLEPELPLLIAAVRLREVDRAETAHKDAGWSKAYRREDREDEERSWGPGEDAGIPPINLDYNSGWQQPLMPGWVRIIKIVFLPLKIHQPLC